MSGGQDGAGPHVQKEGDGHRGACALFQEPGKGGAVICCLQEKQGRGSSVSIPTPHPDQAKMHSKEDFKVLWKNVGMSPFLLISQTLKHAPRGLGERK